MNTIRQDQKVKGPLAILQQHIGIFLTLSVLSLAGAGPLWANSGTWTNKTDSVWSDTTNWTGGIVADGADNLADFSTVASGVTNLNDNYALGDSRSLGRHNKRCDFGFFDGHAKMMKNSAAGYKDPRIWDSALWARDHNSMSPAP